jgi:hypothetical protein
LDRVSDIKSFIKHGAEEGSVEIELKGHPGEKNVTIKLNLILSSNSRVFEVNGKLSHQFFSFLISKHNTCENSTHIMLFSREKNPGQSGPSDRQIVQHPG